MTYRSQVSSNENMLSERSEEYKKPNPSPLKSKISLKKFATPRSSGGMVTIGITNEDNAEDDYPVMMMDEDEDNFRVVQNEDGGSEQRFSVMDSEGIVEIN